VSPRGNRVDFLTQPDPYGLFRDRARTMSESIRISSLTKVLSGDARLGQFRAGDLQAICNIVRRPRQRLMIEDIAGMFPAACA
jgi:hypothetical protein